MNSLSQRLNRGLDRVPSWFGPHPSRDPEPGERFALKLHARNGPLYVSAKNGDILRDMEGRFEPYVVWDADEHSSGHVSPEITHLLEGPGQ